MTFPTVETKLQGSFSKCMRASTGNAHKALTFELFDSLFAINNPATNS
jgi:hypothetical protein